MYCVGAVLDDDRDLYGRTAWLDALANGRDRRVLMVGMRRTGKSSILLGLERLALAGDRFVPVRLALEGSASLAQVRDDLANAISRRRKLLPGLPGGFLVLRGLPLDDLLRVAQDAALDADRQLLLLIDEADALARICETEPELASRMRAGLPEGDGARVVVTGSRRALRLKFEPVGDREPMFADFALHPLPPVLDPASARQLVRLEKRGGTGAATLTDDQVTELLAQTGGHPYLTQAVCAYARQFGATPAEAVAVVMSSHESQDAFQQDLERTSPSERRVLQAVIAGEAPPRELTPFVRSLVEIGLLDATGHLAVPVLRTFLQRAGWDASPSRISDQTAAPGFAAPAPAPTGPVYRPIRDLGKGGFGEVVLVEQEAAEGLRRLVAIKLLHTRHAGDDRLAGALRDEARMLARLRHRAIVKAEAIVRLEGRLGIVMEYVPGTDLATVSKGGGTVPLRALAEIVAEVADALDVALHRVPPGESEPFRVLHRDIKPHNLRITQDGEVKVLDFGIASARFAGREVSANPGALTPAYAAPERLGGLHDLPASDIWSLGVTVLELTGGRLGAPPDRANPAEWNALTAAMVSFDTRARPTAREVSDRMRELAPRMPGPTLRDWAAAVVPALERDETTTGPSVSTMSVFSHPVVPADGGRPA